MEKGAEDEFTLTSFEALSPEQEKSGFFRFIEELTKKKLKWTTDKQDQSSTAIDKAKDGTQFRPRECSFNAEQVLPRKTLKAGNSLPWKPRQSSGVQPKSATVPSNRNTRTPSSVLGRLSLLVLVEKTSHQPSQSRSNLKQYWMPDEQCKICYECGVKFNTFRRRHHCRLCGQIFCSKCCNEELSGHLMGYTGVLRVCIYCKKIVLAYTSSSDIDNNLKQLKKDLSLVSQPDITNSPGHARMRISTYDDPELNRAFDVFGVSAEEANLLKQDSFKELWQQITGPKIGVDFQSHRIRLRTYSNCLVGRDLVDWLLIYRKAPNRYQAQQICQGLQDFGWIEPLVNARESGFKDDVVLYIPGPSATGENNIPGFRTPLSVCESLSSDDNSDDFFPDRNFRESQKREASSFLSESYDKRFTGGRREGFHKSISTPKLGNAEKPFVLQFQNKSLSCEELFLKVDAVGKEEKEKGRRDLAPTNTQSPVLDDFVFVEDCYLPKRLALQQANSSKNAAGSEQEADKEPARDRKLFEFQRGNEEISSFNHLSAIHHQHISSFLSQLLDRVNLSHSWKAIIEPLVLRVSEMVFPDVPQGDDMDIRQFVKIKKISGGAKSDCRIVNGVVCTKNVIHKKMAKSLTQPRILMLACPVDFQRVENKLASLDSLVLQEEEFLKNFVARIVDLQPSIVLVEKTVSRLAQDMLLAKGISVMLNMKPKLMGRISRCTEGDVLPSLDQGRRPRLGTCQQFKIQKFVLKNGNTKTVAFFEGCQPYLGSTIVIRGGNRSELSRIKHILKFMLFVAYNSKLEKAFVMDEFGTPYRNENKQANEERQNGEGLVEDKSGTYLWREGEPVQKKTKNEEQLEKEESRTSSWKEGDPVKKEAKNEESPIEDKFGTGHRKERELIEKGQQNCEVKPGDELWSEEANVVKERTVTAENTCSNDTGDNSVVNGKSFKRISDKVILCSSPLIYYPVPYLLTLEGQRCKLLSYMPDDLYWSPMFSGEAPLEHFSSEEDDEDDVKKSENENIFIKETHPFVHAVWTNGPRDLESRKLLAHFRAEGGKIILKRLRPMINGEGTVPFQNDVDDIDETGEAVEVQMTDTLNLESCDSAPADEQYPMTSTLKRDCFDPFLHQMIAILFSSYAKESGNFPNPCISPWTVFMEFYVKNDIALGCFLETYCFRSSYLCPNPNCDVPMVKHVRYFAHGDGAVYINMRNLESPIPGFSKTLLTWSWCKECKQVTPVVPVSPEAWRLSFAKYLELRIYGNCYRRRATDAPCDHSLHQDHFQYFAFNNIVASFKYVPVKIYEVYLPPSTITLLEQEREPQFWIKHIQAMSVRVHQLVNSTNDRIASLKTESFISNCVTEIGHDQGQLHEKIKVLESKAMLLLSPPSSPGASNESKLLEPHEVSSLEYEILDGITLLKRKMCVLGEKWNAQLLELLQVENEKKKYKTTEGKNSVQPTSQSPIESGNLGHISEDSVYSNWFANSVQQGDSKGSLSRSDSVVVSDNHDTAKNIEEVSQSPDVKKCTNLAGQTLIEDEQTSSSSESETEAKLDMLNGPRGSGSSCEKQLQKHSELWATLSREVDTSLKGEQLQEDRPGPTMKRIISHILPGVNFRAIPSPFPLHEHHLLPSSEMIPIVVNEKEPTSIIAYTLSTIDYNTKLCKIQESMMEMESDESAYIDLELDGVRRLSKNPQSETISTRSRTRSELETLSSTSLMASLDDFMDNYFGCSDSDNEENGPKNDTSKVFPAGKPARDEISENKSSNTKEGLPTSDVDGKEQSSTLNSSTQDEVEYHIRHSFSDSSAKFYCVIYFGEQFRRLRKSVFPDGEERYIRSLQYCLKWRVTGGKSGSSFCKTTDDRFVIKEMSRSEAQSFLNIAPYYFDYIEKTLKEKRPTLLAKIFGVYRIGFTSKITNATIRKDLLVMDNLFYNCHVNKVFDLKGSIRSRYVAMSSEEENNVLMDENLLEMIAESPLFIRPHSKAVLSRAINRDTEFLARHMVMDYSLLLGIEQDTCKLIVGIIDFIRTFTWDKKLEMYVKSTGILGGQGKMPTVVSPELYRERFCEAMQRYFLMIPSKWMGLGNELK